MQTVSTATEEMSASIKEISKNASEAAEVASSAARLAGTTNATMTKLSESSAEIGNVIKVITSIAEQTNLLALNATIEAARAGEAGKGFAVVANEVKELAKETAKATEDIGAKVEAIQNDAKGAVLAIDEITTVIGRINDIQNTIASAVEEQTGTTNEISRNISETAKGSSDIASNITGVATAAKETEHSAGVCGSNAAQELSKLAVRLGGRGQPVQLSNNGRHAQRGRSLVRAHQGRNTVRALIVDDSKAMRSIVGRIVKQIGFEIFEAANGREGLEQLKAHGDVELILVDWNMPEMNGIEFLHAVRAQPGSSAFKMLMVTTASDLAHINTAIEAGANEYLMKPFTKEAMVSKLQMLGMLE